MARETAPLLPAVEHLYVSPMRRCRQTAALLWPGVAQTVIEDLRETDFGPFEGKSHQELGTTPCTSGGWRGRWRWGSPPRTAPAGAPGALEGPGGGRPGPGLYAHWGSPPTGGLLMGMLTRCGRPARTGFYDWYPQNCGGYRAELVREPLELHILGPAGRTKA